jgi:glycosyltransferase involved in cell wall biosynthesis
MSQTFTIIIPVYNEAAFFESAFKQLVDDMSETGIDWDLIVVENGSTDDTADIVSSILEAWNGEGAMLQLPNPDYGAALRAGLLRSSADWTVTFDIDYFSAPFVKTVATTRADIVIASKRAEGSDDRRPAIRRFGTWGLSQVLRFLLSSEVQDTHGIKAFSRSVVDDVAGQVTRTKDLFDTELIIRAERLGYTIVETPIVVEERRAAGSPFLKRIPRTLWGLTQLRRSLPPKTTSR